MAESYLTRRGPSGGGGLGGMNVTIGTSPPSDKVGLFINSETIDTDICYVSPNGIGSGGSWTILPGSTPINSNYSFPAVNGNIVYISAYSTDTIYKYDTTSNSFSSWQTTSSSGYNGAYSWEYCVGNKLYRYSTPNVFGQTSDYNVFVCDLSTDTWSNAGDGASNTACPFGCAYYNDNIYTATNHHVNGVGYKLLIWSFNLSSNLPSVIADTSIKWNNVLYYGTVVSDGVSFYTFGGQSQYVTFGLKWNMQTGEYVIFRGPSTTNLRIITTGYIDGDYLRALSASTLNTKKIPLNMTTNQSFELDDSFELPMSPANRDHTSQIAKVGADLYAFNFGSTMQSILKYKSNTGDFENNSVIVECSLNGNECEIVSSEDGNITVSVGKVYYIDSSGNMSEITSQCQVRTTGENWQQIQ